MNCKELVELVTDYLEGKLPLTERQQFEAHLSGCSGCRNYLDQMQTTIRLSGRLTEDHVPAEGKDTLLQAFRQWKAKSAE
jgi:predicted anti-sigma-YlaC factor YlaD